MAKALSNGKAAGDDLVINEMIKYAPRPLALRLLQLFNAAKLAETCPPLVAHGTS